MDRPKFCHTCGQALIPGTPPRYDMQTGEKINERCPSGECDHFGVLCTYVGGGLWRNGTCIRCGSAEPVWD